MGILFPLQFHISVLYLHLLLSFQGTRKESKKKRDRRNGEMDEIMDEKIEPCYVKGAFLQKNVISVRKKTLRVVPILIDITY